MNKQPAKKTIDVNELKSMIDENHDFQLVDIREDIEREMVNIGGDHIPMNTVEEKLELVARDKPVVVYCHSGNRSRRLIEHLSDRYNFENLINLEGGIDAWSVKIDSSVRRY